MTANATHLAIYGRGTRRLVLTQPPHFRTGSEPNLPGPSLAEKQASIALANSREDLVLHLVRHGITNPVPRQSKRKQQAKKIRQVLEHHAGNH